MDTRAPDRKPAFLSGVFFFLSLQDLFHKVTHGLGSLVLFLPGGVGVGPQGEPGVEVAQHGGHCFYVYILCRQLQSSVLRIFVRIRSWLCVLPTPAALLYSVTR